MPHDRRYRRIEFQASITSPASVVTQQLASPRRLNSQVLISVPLSPPRVGQFQRNITRALASCKRARGRVHATSPLTRTCRRWSARW